MKRMIAFMLAVVIGLSCCACGGAAASKSGSDAASGEAGGASSTVSTIDVDKGLFNVTITLPADFLDEEKTQADYDAIVKETNGLKSITLNEDGSATYVMTKKRHKEMLQDLADSYHESLDEMVSSEDYPNITAITVNDDFTNFTVTTKSTSLGLMESLSILIFYMEGGMYGAMSGVTPENIHVDFVNADTGEIIDSADSANATN